MGAIIGIPVLAWAKPVPVNPNRMHNPRRDMLFVSLAGPASNFLMMILAALAARALFDPSTVPPVFSVPELPLGVQILFLYAVVNLFLGLFNLLPIPPLDGSSLIERVLPATWLPQWYKVRPYGLLVLFLGCFGAGVISEFLDPFINHSRLPMTMRRSGGWADARDAGAKSTKRRRSPVGPLRAGRWRGRQVGRRRVGQWCSSVGFVQFRRQPNHDQRHATASPATCGALAGTEYADDPLAVGRATARHRQARLAPRRLRPGGGDDLGRGGGARARRGVVGVERLHPPGRPLPAPHRARR
jgi:hypothetical protein